MSKLKVVNHPGFPPQEFYHETIISFCIQSCEAEFRLDEIKSEYGDGVIINIDIREAYDDWGTEIDVTYSKVRTNADYSTKKAEYETRLEAYNLYQEALAQHTQTLAAEKKLKDEKATYERLKKKFGDQ